MPALRLVSRARAVFRRTVVTFRAGSLKPARGREEVPGRSPATPGSRPAAAKRSISSGSIRAAKLGKHHRNGCGARGGIRLGPRPPLHEKGERQKQDRCRPAVPFQPTRARPRIFHGDGFGQPRRQCWPRNGSCIRMLTISCRHDHQPRSQSSQAEGAPRLPAALSRKP